jgi:hypothetical protein
MQNVSVYTFNLCRIFQTLTGLLSYGLDDQEFESWQGLGIFLFTTMSTLALGPTQLPIQWVPGVLYLVIKWSGCETDHSPPSSAKVKECVELYLHFPNMPSSHGAQLKKAQERLYLYHYHFLIVIFAYTSLF